MLKLRFLFATVLFFICLTFEALSQKQTEKWYFAGSGPAPALDFSSGMPVPILNSVITTSHESSCSLADANGDLLFYTDGNRNCYNKNHVLMTNGNDIFMHNSITQGCVFVKKPGANSIYYLIHIGLPTLGGGPYNMYYTEIDMSLNGGLGQVISKNNNISLGNMSEKMSVVEHCNGVDYWVLVHSFTGNSFRAHLITSAGINLTPVISSVGSNHISNDEMGQMKISPNGLKVAMVLHQQNIVELFDFNKSTGVVSNPIVLGNTGSQYGYGVEFSRNNRLLYISGGGSPGVIKQWNLCAGTQAQIISSGINVGTGSIYPLQMAPDNKIYGANFATTMSVINNPDILGAGCNFTHNSLSIAPSMTSIGLPNFIVSFFNTVDLAYVTTVDDACGACNGAATAIIKGCMGAPFLYEWSNGTTIGPTSDTSSTISNLCAGSYYVVVSDASCKKDTIHFTIASQGSLNVTIQSSVNALCTGQNATLSVSNAPSGATYIWSTGATTPSINVSPVVNTTYSVTVSDGSGCTGTDNYTIIVNTMPSIPLVTVDCSGGLGNAIIIVTSPVGAGYEYSLNGGAYQTSNMFYSLNNASYTIYVRDSNFCINSAPVIVNCLCAAEPSILLNGNDTIICGIVPVTVNNNLFGGSATHVTFMHNGSGTLIPLSTSVSPFSFTYNPVAADVGNTVVITITTDNPLGPPCTPAIATYNIVINSLPILIATANPSIICIGETSVLSVSGANTYMWSHSLGTNANITVTPVVSTTYTVTGTQNGCSATQSVSVIVTPAPILSFTHTPNAPYCAGDTITITASGATNYIWGTGSNNASITITPQITTTYTITASHSSACSSSTSVVVFVHPALNVNLTAQPSDLCLGSSTVLTVSGADNYIWNSNLGSGSSHTVYPTVNTTYSVTGTSLSGSCSGTASVAVNVFPQPVVAAIANPQAVCVGSVVLLSASGGNSYIWDNGQQLGSFSDSIFQTTLYSVTATDINGCIGTAQVQVDVYPALSVTVTPSYSEVCKGEDLILLAQSNGSNLTFVWSSGHQTQTIVVNPQADIDYIVSVSDDMGCSGTAVASVIVKPLPNVSFSALPTEGCLPLEVSFYNQSDPGIYFWHFGDGNTSNAQTPTQTYNSAGLYTVSLIVTNALGCEATYSITDYIQVHPYPVAGFYPNQSIIYDSYNVVFTDLSVGANHWYWDFGTGSSIDVSFNQNPSFLYQEPGQYVVWQFVQNQWGCKDSVFAIIKYLPTSTVYIPNAFSPDGDGMNDFFQIYGTNISAIELYIFDRWGKLIFETDDLNKQWDGKNKDTGLIYPEGVYVYKLFMTDDSGFTKPYYGLVTLIRGF